MSRRRELRTVTATACLLALVLASACGALRSEFFRGETAHLLRLGNRHYRSGEFEEAGTCYERAIGVDPGCARAHAALGNVAYVRGAFRAASTRYGRAVDLDPALEVSLAPLLLDCGRLQERGELEALGAEPLEVLHLLLSGREADVETLLEEGVSETMLARHMTCLPWRDRERILDLAAKRACAGTVSPRCMLLYGHLLAVDEQRGCLAARLLEAGAEKVEGEARRRAFMALGALLVRLGRESDAAWAYEAALEAGCSRNEVIPLLAHLYGVPPGAIPAIPGTPYSIQPPSPHGNERWPE